MRTDTEMALLSTTVLRAMDDLRWHLQRHGPLMDLLEAKGELIANLSRECDAKDATIDICRRRIAELTARCAELERKASDAD